MRRTPFFAALCATLAVAFVATSSAADSPKTQAAQQKGAAGQGTGGAGNGAIPAEVRARVVAKLHGASPNDVSLSPIPGLYEVTMGGLIAYVTEDGKYLVSGNVYDLDTEANLTASRRNAVRAK